MKYSLNLSTRSYVNRRTLYLSYAVVGALLCAVLLFNLMRFVSLNNEIDSTAGKIKQIVARSGANVADFDETSYQNLLANIQDANRILQRDNFRWTKLLDQLELVVPRAVRISQIEPDHDEGTVKLLGQAKTLKGLKRFIDNLIKSGNYLHVYLERQATDAKSGYLRFSIRLEGAF